MPRRERYPLEAMHVGVYGLGRFGNLWAQLLSGTFPVSAFNRSARPVPDGVELVDEARLAECDIVFLCVSIRAVGSVCRRLAEVLQPGTAVADTCSVKLHPLNIMRRELPAYTPILGTHPMFGPDSVGASGHPLPVVITPGRDSESLETIWAGYFSELGFEVHTMSADEHDSEAARTQGITHLVGRILGELDLPDSAIATTGYRRLQQLVEQTCNDPYELFEDLLLLNPHASRARTAFEQSVEHVLARLDSAGADSDLDRRPGSAGRESAGGRGIENRSRRDRRDD